MKVKKFKTQSLLVKNNNFFFITKSITVTKIHSNFCTYLTLEHDRSISGEITEEYQF